MMVEASLVKLSWDECNWKLTDDKSTLVQVMAWCRQATSHYLSQCWPESLSTYGVTRPQWVKCELDLEHIEISTKWLPFCREHFLMHFLEKKNVFGAYFTEAGLSVNIFCWGSKALTIYFHGSQAYFGGSLYKNTSQILQFLAIH